MRGPGKATVNRAFCGQVHTQCLGIYHGCHSDHSLGAARPISLCLHSSLLPGDQDPLGPPLPLLHSVRLVGSSPHSCFCSFSIRSLLCLCQSQRSKIHTAGWTHPGQALGGPESPSIPASCSLEGAEEQNNFKSTCRKLELFRIEQTALSAPVKFSLGS